MKDFAVEYYTERDGEIIKTWIHIKAKDEKEVIEITKRIGIKAVNIQEAD